MAEPAAPEQEFFADPALDRLMGVVFNLASELQVTRDRLTVIEMILEQQTGFRRADIDAFVPTPAQAREIDRDGKDTVAHLLAPLLGRQASKSVGP